MTKINPLVYYIGGPVVVGLFGIWFYFKGGEVGTKTKTTIETQNLLKDNFGIINTGESERNKQIYEIRTKLEKSTLSKNEESKLRAELFELTLDPADIEPEVDQLISKGGKRSKRRNKRNKRNKSIKKIYK
jgi:uncharacterized protein (UPF0333 family)